MKLKVIGELEYKKFALSNPYISIYQLPEWGHLKATTGWKSHLVGLYDNDTLKAVSLILEKSEPLGLNLFYAPRGYLLDVFDYKLLNEFHKEVIKYVKKNKGFLLKVDPNVIYALYDKEGNLINNDGKKAWDNFIKLGFKHLGFTKNFETLQPRYLCRIKLEKTYEETLQTFTKNTRKNIEKTIGMGVKVRVVDSKDMNHFTELLKLSADKNHFIIRPSSYYKKMDDLMSDYIRLYIAYIDTEEYFNNLKSDYDNIKEELTEFECEMQKINNGEKVKKHHQDLVIKLEKIEERLKYAKKLINIGKMIDIGCLMSVFIGNEGITFMSGTSLEYREFGPKYAFYNEHIKDAIKMHKEYVNFYGISGDLSKDSPYYNIYEIKKGFNPEIVELLGEFDYVISKPKYMLYKVALKAYKIIKKLRK